MPRGVPGSAGPPYVGIEHIKGVYATAGLLAHTFDDKKGPARATSLAPLASWTATAYVAELNGKPVKPTASALDLKRSVYEVATSPCVQRTYAHRAQQHLLLTEFTCTNEKSTALEVTIKQRGWCPEANQKDLSAYSVYDVICPKTNASNGGHGSQMGYLRVDEPSHLDGVTCSRSTMGGSETPETPAAVVGECHTTVPKEGLKFTVEEKTARGGPSSKVFTLISARYSNMDAGLTASKTAEMRDSPVSKAKAAYIAANRTGLFTQHTISIAGLNEPGIEVEGNLEFARVVNASLYTLRNSYRVDSPYSGAPEGLCATRYYGCATRNSNSRHQPGCFA